MLAPDQRVVLREQLRPEPGWELDFAVATTFTLDLTAALVAPLAFAADYVTRSEDPIAVLEAIRRVTDRIMVFCQAGNVRVPAKPSDLMAFLEPMVCEVTAPNPGFLFHPKIWLARYRSHQEVSYRLLCGTRNLTDDVSWDAIVRLDGFPGTRRYVENRPLADLVKALPSMAVRSLAADRAARVQELGEEARRIEWEYPSEVNEVVFHALGLRRTRTSSLEDALVGRKHLIVSPFLDDRGIVDATTASEYVTVVSRPEALERLSPETLAGLACRIVSPMAGLAQPEDGDRGPGGSDDSLLGGLHAKVYVVESGKQARLFIGSANATRAGLHDQNVEFVIEMVAGPKTFGVERFLGADAPFASLLEHYQPSGGQAEPPEDVVGRELENLLRRVASGSLVADVQQSSDGWAEHVRGTALVDLPQATSLRVALLTGSRGVEVEPGRAIETRFEALPTADITPFVVLTATKAHGGLTISRSAVVRAELRGDPEGRFDEVIARQVDTPEKFLRFLALLLGLSSDFAIAPDEQPGGAVWALSSQGGAGIFEMLVRALAERPEAIDDLERLVARLSSTEKGSVLMPPGFTNLWERVSGARRSMKAGQ